MKVTIQGGSVNITGLSKYQGVTEPVFVLRASDERAGNALRAYLQTALKNVTPSAERAINEKVQAFSQWVQKRRADCDVQEIDKDGVKMTAAEMLNELIDHNDLQILPTEDIDLAMMVLNNKMNPKAITVRHGSDIPAVPETTPEPELKDIQPGQIITPVADKPSIELEKYCLNDLS